MATTVGPSEVEDELDVDDVESSVVVVGVLSPPPPSPSVGGITSGGMRPTGAIPPPRIPVVTVST